MTEPRARRTSGGIPEQIGLEDFVESVTRAVLRALDAREEAATLDLRERNATSGIWISVQGRTRELSRPVGIEPSGPTGAPSAVDA
jgi:hypothetical protein